jgi:hypothetical protein
MEVEVLWFAHSLTGKKCIKRLGAQRPMVSPFREGSQKSMDRLGNPTLKSGVIKIAIVIVNRVGISRKILSDYSVLSFTGRKSRY